MKFTKIWNRDDNKRLPYTGNNLKWCNQRKVFTSKYTISKFFNIINIFVVCNSSAVPLHKNAQLPPPHHKSTQFPLRCFASVPCLCQQTAFLLDRALTRSVMYWFYFIRNIQFFAEQRPLQSRIVELCASCFSMPEY